MAGGDGLKAGVTAFLQRWKKAVSSVWKDFSRHDGPQAAAALSFYAFLSLFALLILAGGVLGMLFKGRPDLHQRAVDYLVSNAPGISDIIEQALNTTADLGGLLGAIGLAGMLITGTKVTDSLQVWLNKIWGFDKPAFLRRKLKGLAILLVLALVVMLSFGLQVVIVYVAGKVGALEFPLSLLSFLGAVAIQAAGLAVIYAYALEGRVGISETWKRGLLVALLVNPLLLLLTWYYTNMGDLSAVYGPFAGVVLGILTLYYAASVLFLGAELNRFLHSPAEEGLPC